MMDHYFSFGLQYSHFFLQFAPHAAGNCLYEVIKLRNVAQHCFESKPLSVSVHVIAS